MYSKEIEKLLKEVKVVEKNGVKELNVKEGMSDKEIKEEVFKFNKYLDRLKFKVNNEYKKGNIEEKVWKKELNSLVIKKEKSRILESMLYGKVVKCYEDRSIEEIEEMSVDELERGKRSLSSKKSRSGWSISEEEYKKLEDKYKEYDKVYREKRKSEKGLVSKVKVNDIVDIIKNNDMSKEDILRMLENM